MAEGKAHAQDEGGFRFESCLGWVTHVSFNTYYVDYNININCGGSYHKDIVSSLLVREWTCPDCGSIHDRDTNAAKNIRLSGMLIFQ